MTSTARLAAALPFAVALAAAAALAPSALAQAPAAGEAQPAPGRIVYTRGADGVIDVYTAAPDGSDEVRLSDIEESSAGEYQPRFSPDGRSVVFATTDVEGLATYWTIPATGGEPQAIVERDGQGLDPAWSPDGRCVAYSGAHESGGLIQPERHDLKVWCDGEPLRTLTTTADVDEREPEWSPGGDRLAFAARNVAGSRRTWRIESIALDGSDRRTLLDRGVHDRQPRFAPDGERLAFIASDLADLPIGTLSVLDLASGRIDALVRRPAASFGWSPDGAELVFGNIDNERVDVIAPQDPPLLLGAVLARPALLAGGAQAATAKGLYRLDLASRTAARLKGAAGGAESQPNRYDFGFAPDWSPGTATPTPDATATPTPTATRSATATASATATGRASATATRTATREPTPTPQRPALYLPIALKAWPPVAKPTSEATRTRTPSASPTPTTGPGSPAPSPTAGMAEATPAATGSPTVTPDASATPPGEAAVR